MKYNKFCCSYSSWGVGNHLCFLYLFLKQVKFFELLFLVPALFKSVRYVKYGGQIVGAVGL